CRAVRAAALWVDDAIRGIDHTKRLPPADISLFDAKLIGITAAARDLDLDVGSTSRFDAQLPGEIVDGDTVTGETATFGLCPKRSNHYETAEQREPNSGLWKQRHTTFGGEKARRARSASVQSDSTNPATVGRRAASLVDVLDRPSPVDAILGSHVPARYDAGVLVAVLADVEQVLSAGQQGAAADAVFGRRTIQLSLEAREQFAGDVGRETMSLGRIHKTEEDEVEEQHLPLRFEALHQTSPIDCFGARPTQVH